RPVRGQLLERGPDPLERDAGRLSRLHERDAPQGDARVAPLVAVRPSSRDEPFALVEAESRLGDPAPLGELADGQLSHHLTSTIVEVLRCVHCSYDDTR